MPIQIKFIIEKKRELRRRQGTTREGNGEQRRGKKRRKDEEKNKRFMVIILKTNSSPRFFASRQHLARWTVIIRARKKTLLHISTETNTKQDELGRFRPVAAKC